MEHFSALVPLTPRISTSWVQKVLREMVINPPKKWPTLEAKGTLIKYRPVCAVTPIRRASTIAGLDRWTGLEWNGMDWTGLDWSGLEWAAQSDSRM